MVIVCKRRGYSYELKEVIELLFHKMTDDPMNNKDVKKVGPGPPGGRQPSGLREESWGGLENGVSTDADWVALQCGQGLPFCHPLVPLTCEDSTLTPCQVRHFPGPLSDFSRGGDAPGIMVPG